jgi:presenilin-like A22 family membrane protease
VRLPWQWLCYIALLFLLSSGQLLRKLLTDTGGPPSRYGGLFVEVLILLFTSAWLNQRALGKQWHWKVLLELLVIAGIGFSVFLAFAAVYQSASLLAIGAVLLLPALSALFQYIYR